MGIVSLLALASNIVLAFAASCPLVLKQDFNKHVKDASYTQTMVETDFPGAAGPFKVLGPEGSAKVGNGTLTGHFPKGQILGEVSGFTWFAILTPLKEASMSYDVFFEPGFDWTYGGKLPGFCGGDCVRGCSAVSKTRGWSTRLMWQRRGGMITYAYYPDKATARCGEAWGWSQGVTDGKWHNIRVYARINTPGVADGISSAWLDGHLVLNKTDIMYRYVDDAEHTITKAYITTYVGGSSVEDFAPDHDQTIKFDNFHVWAGACAQADPAASALKTEL